MKMQAKKQSDSSAAMSAESGLCPIDSAPNMQAANMPIGVNRDFM